MHLNFKEAVLGELTQKTAFNRHYTLALTKSMETIAALRRVPAIVTAHTFWASQDTWVFYGWCLLKDP